MTKREQFLQWLADAHAMEMGIVTSLEKHIVDAKGQSEIKSALQNHLRQTKNHAKEIGKALESLGGGRPVIKEGVSKLATLAVGLVSTAAGDTAIKNAIADFATEHLEIACYTSLIFTATELGEKEIAATCKAILKEEKQMAKVLEAQFLGINAAYLKTLDDDPKKKTVSASKTPRRATSKKITKSKK